MTHFVGPTSGNNPRWGRDEGGTPTAGRAAPFHPGFLYGGIPPPPPAHPFQYTMPYSQPYPNHHAVPNPQPQQRGYTYVSGLGGGNRHPAPYPIINPELPAANMTNSTGGVGCEPGYNYFFPAEHTKIHVLKTGATPPWQLPSNASVPFHACHVPVSTTIGELMEGFGATNRVPKKNRITEVVQGGNGKWYKGLGFGGENAKDMLKTLKELGWDKTRSGLPGQKPVVYLYVTKD